eukprot:Blabericola_migrator_1__8388@NODE_436_length_8493_cov_87_644434_g342_i0_p9_GENE_NODE_436_length_8493_cov_87_644434_g342_i0NODE_436_length_8493_cov_87_644434_g342_i0_p9_ORF_typecomplete_len105_score13_56_NODE_436_length_8493_cov_87_644434_g342_i028603174
MRSLQTRFKDAVVKEPMTRTLLKAIHAPTMTIQNSFALLIIKAYKNALDFVKKNASLYKGFGLALVSVRLQSHMHYLMPSYFVRLLMDMLVMSLVSAGAELSRE